MKKIFLTLAVATCFAGTSQAQLHKPRTVYGGVKLGGSVSNFIGDQSQYLRNLTGLHGGLFANFKLAEPLSLQLEALYSMKGAKANAAVNDASTRLNYVDVPLSLRYSLYDLFVEAGAQASFLVSAKFDNLTDKVDVKPAYRSIDAGYLAGIGYQPQRGGLGVGFRYNASVLSAPKDLPDGVKLDQRNSVVQLYVTYSPKPPRKYKKKR